MRTFDNYEAKLSSGDGTKLINGTPTVAIAQDVNFLKTLREDKTQDEAYSWFDRAEGLRVFDSAGNLFKFDITEAIFVDTIIAKQGLFINSDSSPLTSILTECNYMVDENLTYNYYYQRAYQHRAHGFELNSATSLLGLRFRLDLDGSDFIPNEWYTSPTGNFIVYQSSDNSTWTEVKQFPVNASDDKLRYITEPEAGFCYIDLWFDQPVSAKYFKVYYDQRFYIADDGATAHQYFHNVELLGYPIHEDDSIVLTDGLKDDSFSNTEASQYSVVPGGQSNYIDNNTSYGDSSPYDTDCFRGCKCDKNYAVTALQCHGKIDPGQTVDSISGWTAGPVSFALYGSHDNIHWTYIETINVDDVWGDSEIGEFSLQFTSTQSFKYYGFAGTSGPWMWHYYHNSGMDEDDTEFYFTEIQPIYSS